MTPKQSNALTYLMGENLRMKLIARRKYLEALRKAYKSHDISEKRREYRRLEAIEAGLSARLDLDRAK